MIGTEAMLTGFYRARKILALFALAAFSEPSMAYGSSLGSLLSQQRVLGDFNGWIVSSGKTVDGSSYCSIDALATNGLMSFRTVSTSPNQYEWHVSVHDYQAPKTSTVTAIAYVANPMPIQVPLTVIRPGATIKSQNKYWFMVETEDLATLTNIANNSSPQEEIRFTFPNTIYPPVIARIGGLKVAASAYIACVRGMR
jgi:hypothetical protein